MSLSDIIVNLKANCIDFFQYSEAEKNVHKYSNLLDDLDQQIDKCTTYLNEFSDTVNQCKDRLYRNEDCAQGTLNTAFQSKLEQWDYDTSNLLARFYDALEQTQDLRQQASDSLSYWQEQEDQEEQDLRKQLKEKLKWR